MTVFEVTRKGKYIFKNIRVKKENMNRNIFGLTKNGKYGYGYLVCYLRLCIQIQIFVTHCCSLIDLTYFYINFQGTRYPDTKEQREYKT